MRYQYARGAEDLTRSPGSGRIQSAARPRGANSGETASGGFTVTHSRRIVGGLVLTLACILAACGDPGGGGGYCIVSYNTGSYGFGIGGGTPPASQYVALGSVITLPGMGGMTPPITGETFLGWSDAQFHEAGASYTVHATLTLTARWGFTDIDAISDYLNTANGTKSEPADLRVCLDLEDDWEDLLALLYTAGDYVDLDLLLSATTGANGEFDADPALTGDAQSGKGYVFTLALPNAATSVKAGTDSVPTFEGFDELTAVRGEWVTAIGNYAFSALPVLRSAQFGRAAFIGEGAFYNCPLLLNLGLNEVVSIDVAAFEGCTNLDYINLPATLTTFTNNPFAGCTSLDNLSVAPGNASFSALNGRLMDKARTTLIAYPSAKDEVTGLTAITTVGNYAFSGCADLTSVLLPNATSFGAGAFANTGTGPLTVILGATPPSVGPNMFNGVTGGPKNVTVKVPYDNSAAWEPEGYTTAWLSSFNANANVTVTIEAAP
ncbi:MAG: leucine-rich repeat domain-containing protein [Treponema sp.]|jgi:hypothetical protein|nr:leucine-rich repeat domain-containing protein [Treponema sp.]